MAPRTAARAGVALVCALALSWPTCSAGARDQSLHNAMEVEAGNSSVVVALGRHDNMTPVTHEEEEGPRGTGKDQEGPADKHEEHSALSPPQPHRWQNTSMKNTSMKNTSMKDHRWQKTVPYFLGLPEFNGTVCEREKDKVKHDLVLHDNWLTRFYWCVPFLIVPLILNLAYCFSSGAVLKAFGASMQTWCGFFIANWLTMILISPKLMTALFPALKFDLKELRLSSSPASISFHPLLRILSVAAWGVIVRVVAAAHENPDILKLFSSLPPDESVSRDHAAATFKPVSIYMNPKRSMDDVMMRFTGQSLLMMYYWAHLEKSENDLDRASCSVLRMQFICIVLAVVPFLQGVLRAAMGKEFVANAGLWMMLLRSRGYKVADEEEFTKTRRSEIRIRMVMGFVVNQVYNGMLLFTVHTLCFFDPFLNVIKTLFCVAIITKVSAEDEAVEIHTTVDEIGKEGHAPR